MKEQINELVRRIEEYNRQYARRSAAIYDMLIRYRLVIPLYDVDVDVTLFVPNWEEFNVVQERHDFSGVNLDSSTDMELVKEARLILEHVFNKHGLHSEGFLNVYTRDFWGPDYTLAKHLKIDFQTYRKDDLRVYFNGHISTLQEYIKSSGSIKFDIPVNELIKDEKTWGYDRMDMINAAKFTSPRQSAGFGAGSPHNITIGLHLANVEKVPDTPIHDVVSVTGHQDANSNKYFFKAKDAVTITLSIKHKIFYRIFEWNWNDATGTPRYNLWVRIRRVRDNAVIRDWLINKEEEFVFPEETNSFRYSTVSIDESFDVPLATNDELVYEVVTEGGRPDYIGYFNTDQFGVEWIAKGSPLDINVFKPESLLQSLVDKIAEGKDFTSAIEWGSEEDKQIRMCAAESIRNMKVTDKTPKGAQFHGSYVDFREWMHMMGYEHVFYDNHIVYKPRDTQFKKGVVAQELMPREIKKLHIAADPEHAYTSVEVGYKKQNYDSVNGKLEVMGAFSYSTNYINYGENILKLISPYRADSIGIELLAWEYLKDTTDTKSDNDLFVVVLDYDEEKQMYVSSKAELVQSGGVTLFNGLLTPENIVKRNESRIGIITNKLSFKGTDANRDAKKAERPIYDDVEIEKKLFEPVRYTIDVTMRQPLPDENVRDGEIHFFYKGASYRGFIRSIMKPYGSKGVSEWELQKVE